MLGRLLLLFFLFASFAFSTTLEIKKGWQLLGVPVTLDVATTFNTKSVDIVWGFDGATQSWRGYSPDAKTQTKILQQHAQLTSLEPWQAFWVFSTSDWRLDFKEHSLATRAKNSTITLEEGWNLVALPQKSVVSKNFFGDAVVWKYTADNEWNVNDETLSFPPIDAIATSEGLWVKSETRQSIDVGERLSKLSTFESEASMLEYIRQMLKMNNYNYYGIVEPALDGGPEMIMDETTSAEPSPVAPQNSGAETSTTDSSAKNSTTTNLQEAGVDESDIIKNDGTHIFSVDNNSHKIVVTSFSNIAKQNYKPITEIDMAEKNVIAMFLQENRLSVISNRYYNYIYDDMPMAEDSVAVRSMPYYYTEPKFVLDIFDVSNIESISSISSYKIDGNYQDSRLIDGKLFLISQFSPNIEYEYLKIYPNTVCSTIDRNEIYANCSGYTTPVEPICPPGAEVCILGTPDIAPNEKQCEYGPQYQLWQDNRCYEYNYDSQGAWKYDYDNPIIKSENLIPSITKDGTTSALVSPSKFYAPVKLDQRANITSISSFDISTATLTETISFLGNTHTTYASTTSLYLVSSEYPLYYDYEHYKEQQMIYKFSLADVMGYVGRGFVEGRMLNQFSMSEKDDYLRVATTSGWSWWGNGATLNTVYTLKNSDETLKVKGVLSGLGHENETIRAVRFMGDRGFVVTFEQSDPLYTLDLSDPESPKKVGELTIPGFSTYLHVIDENRLLSIGRNADANGRQQELQFQLFDISDFAHPRLADKLQIGNTNTYSEAEYNHKAFAYRASDKTFAVAYQSYDYGYKNQSENLGVYQINGMHIESLHTIVSSDSNWGNVGRGLIFDYESSIYAALIKGSNIICETVEKK
jgi:uncharacterized secreted protein with C-terminal beta-propeller domain